MSSIPSCNAHQPCHAQNHISPAGDDKGDAIPACPHATGSAPISSTHVAAFDMAAMLEAVASRSEDPPHGERPGYAPSPLTPEEAAASRPSHAGRPNLRGIFFHG